MPKRGSRKKDHSRKNSWLKQQGRFRPSRTLKAVVDKNQRGFGFLIFDDEKQEDLFMPPRQAQSFFHGDRVEVTLQRSGEIERIRVLEHRFRELIGKYTPHPSDPQKGGWVVYERKKAREEVFVPGGAPKGAHAGEWVRAKLSFHESGPLSVTAKITEKYGPNLPAYADVALVAAEFNLVENHPETTVHEAREHRLDIPDRDLKDRKDLRKIPFITIDGETARDFDDAIYVERKKSGFVLWVAIADVSHYVREGSALDKDSRSRGTSVYFPERAFHMLPRELSEQLCSLKPHEPRLAMVAKIELDRNGKKLSTEVSNAVIESRRRATYTEIQAEWEKNGKNQGWEYESHFALFQILKEVRRKRGSIDFDLPEPDMVVKPDGEVVSIRQRARLDVHRLIEEFMIAANEAVTEWMMMRAWPFVYRTHEEPSEKSLKKFQKLAATVGIRFSVENAAESPLVLADLVRRLEGHTAQALLNMALLRSMKQAIYSASHGIHYGLASEGYTHFTSPIRRYPDLVVHRLLKWALKVEMGQAPALKGGAREKLERELAEICEHCSYRERLAADAEREAIRIKQVRAILPRLGEEFDAKVIGMAEFGLFVQVADPYVEGLISRDSMVDDFYEFNEGRMVFFGRRKKKVFKIGDSLRVRALRANLDRRQIDFGLI